MEVKVNGESQLLSQDPTRLTELLMQMGLAADMTGIAVAVNWELVPRGEWAETMIHAGDEIEIVTARQGG